MRLNSGPFMTCSVCKNRMFDNNTITYDNIHFNDECTLFCNSDYVLDSPCTCHSFLEETRCYVDPYTQVNNSTISKIIELNTKFLPC
jgi:hypothetical protein